MSKPSREVLQAQLERADAVASAKHIVWDESYSMDERLDAIEYLIEVGEVEFK